MKRPATPKKSSRPKKENTPSAPVPPTEPFVLLVEDDAAMADLVKVCLAEKRVHVRHAASLAEGEKYLRDRPSLVVLDWNLPDGEGITLLETIRKDFLLAHTPVIMLTARHQVEEKVIGLSRGADDYLTKPFQRAELQARVTALLRRSLRDLGANPLTGLPGNAQIQDEVESRLSRSEHFDAVYCDINNFKAYNDRYGFVRGDEAIKIFAECLLADNEPGTFVGHIGGDDFVVIMGPGRGEAFAAKTLDKFEKRRRDLHDLRDVARGSYEAVDRQGNVQQFPLLSVTAVVLSTPVRRIRHYAELGQYAAELKSAARREGVSIRPEKRRG
jgi:diguanylate cyclase (GGDEF)-like protein